MAIGHVELGRTVHLLLESAKQDLNNQLPPSIYMVPRVFRDLSPSSYNPKVVSIGPLHREDEILLGFEAHKATYLHDLLDCTGSPREQTLKECFEKVSGSIDRIKACYLGMKAYNDLELTKMKVIDACFILDFIRRLSTRDGPLRKNMLITQSIIYDLLWIENQIPFFVLEDIFECTILKSEPTASLTNHIEVLLIYYNVFDGKLAIGNIVSLDTTHDHILGLVHKAYQPSHDTPSTLGSFPKAHSAVELDRAGVNFRPYEDDNWPMAMKLELPKFSCFPCFCCKPTLRMPVLCIDDFTDLVLRNLIIFEQSSLVDNYVTAYACAMDMLIDTPEDVA